MRIPIKSNKQSNIGTETKVNQNLAIRLNKIAQNDLDTDEEQDDDRLITSSLNMQARTKKRKDQGGHLRDKESKLQLKLKKGRRERAQSLLADDRFARLFSDADFVIEEPAS